MEGIQKYEYLFLLEKCLNCKECVNNIYNKNINKYTIEKEDFEKLNKSIREIIKDLLNMKEK